jgi:hypothetical protein
LGSGDAAYRADVSTARIHERDSVRDEEWSGSKKHGACDFAGRHGMQLLFEMVLV